LFTLMFGCELHSGQHYTLILTFLC